jgi:hypothetical protein
MKAAFTAGNDPRPTRGPEIVRRSLDLIRRRLPERWSLHVRSGRAPIAEIRAPDGASATLAILARPTLVTNQLAGILEALGGNASAVPVVASRYLSPSVRDWLERRRVSYMDATGNVYLVVDRPALFLRDRGADRDPWRGPGRPRGNLAGTPAARVVRTLVDFAPPLSVPALVERSGASTGATYRVVRFLEDEALLTRDPRGPIRTVAWRQIIERWSQDYGFQRSNQVQSFLEPRGLPALIDRLARSNGLRYAVSGSVAVQQWAPYAPARAAMVYVDDIGQAAESLALRPVESGGNVLLAAADDDFVFERTTHQEGLAIVAPSQAAVDLLTGPGRNPAEAQALLDWMETNESDWRQ